MGFIANMLGLGGATTPQYDVAQGLPGYMPTGDNTGLFTARGWTAGDQQQQQNFLNSLQNYNGLNASQYGVLGQQQNLANELQTASQGGGPNPAAAQLAQNTGQNMQQQAAMAAGVRGGQSNPGLVARQAGQAGANAQQQAVGQAATMNAQQQIAARQQLAAQQGQMANLATAGVGQQQAGLAQLNSNALNYQQMLENSLTQQNAQQVQARAANVPMYQTGMQGQQGLLGGVLGGVGGMMGGIGKAIGIAHGGQVPGYAVGGDVANSTPTDIQQKSEPKSILGKVANGIQSGISSGGTPANSSPNGLMSGVQTALNGFGQGIGNLFTPTPTTPAIQRPDESQTMAAAMGAPGYVDANGVPNNAAWATMMGAPQSQGGKINGEAKVAGDSKKNDTVPAMLSPGEVVIPRTKVADPKMAADFLNHLMGWKLRT